MIIYELHFKQHLHLITNAQVKGNFFEEMFAEDSEGVFILQIQKVRVTFSKNDLLSSLALDKM